MKNKKNTKKILVLNIMIGLFIILVGAMGFVRNPEITDIVMIISGFVMTGVGVYKLIL